MRFLIPGFLLLLVFGCLQPETAFTYQDVENPCNVIYSGEVRALYDFKGIKETPVVDDDFTFCMFSGQTTANESNLLTRHQIMLMYFPDAAQNKTIQENFIFENSTESAFILEKDFGLGDQSFLALRWNKETKEIIYMSAVVLVNNSAIIATDAGTQMSGVDYGEKEKIKELASLALDRLT